MGRRTRAIMVVLGLLSSGGFLLAGPGTGCTSFIAESALVSTDFCFIFDCQNGLLGGTINPCPGIPGGAQTIESAVFTDCP